MIAGIILAGGEGKRFGMPKAVAIHKNKTFLEHQYLLLKDFCAPLVAVIGAEPNRVKKLHTHLYIVWSENPNWQNGQFSSIQTGIKSIPDNHAIIIQPVDVLNVNPKTIKSLVDAYERNKSTFAVVPTYKGKSGHPILISPSLTKKIVEFTFDARLDEIMHNLHSVLKVEVDDEAILNNTNEKKNIKKT